jgi:hypothetical protein
MPRRRCPHQPAADDDVFEIDCHAVSSQQRRVFSDAQRALQHFELLYNSLNRFRL